MFSRPAFTNGSSSRTPAELLPPAAVLIASLSVLGSPRIAATIRLGAAGWAACPVWAEGVALGAGAHAVTTNAAAKRTTANRCMAPPVPLSLGRGPGDGGLKRILLSPVLE